MVDLLEADDLFLVQHLDRVKAQVPSALCCAPERRLVDGLEEIRGHNLTEMNATEAARAEGSMNNEVLDGISRLGPSLEY